MTREEDWRRVVGEMVSRFGDVDILVNNAGIYRIAPLEQTSEELWSQIIEVNLNGGFLGTRAVIPEMKKGGGGSIGNISSTAGLRGSPNTSAYHASKGAVRMFTKATAIEYAKDGIRSNSVYPGAIDTEMLAEVELKDPTARRRRLDVIPLGRIGTAEDVAYGVLYLASDEASFVTGADLVIDGGRTAR